MISSTIHYHYQRSMEQNEYHHHGIQVQEKYAKYHFLRRSLLQFLVSVFLFSLLLFFSSAGFSVLPSSFIIFNTRLFSFLTHTLERKYMFVICNGILAFLAKTSSSSASSFTAWPTLSNSNCNGEYWTTSKSLATKAAAVIPDEDGPVVSQVLDFSFVTEAKEEGREKANKQKDLQVNDDTGQEEETLINEYLSSLDDEDKEEKRGNLGKEEDDDDMEEAEEEEASDHELLRTEELNRRFEDFIRKMKEEIRIELAQCQLVNGVA
ncbi:hypothetical protein Tsubulata_039640 [Turnera subulata]|uniref:DUF4408 domain-containing protein n=1 Tax=Turnera subulata TaxID=218843 RepID=A0A9Q0IZY8_9ROSI|nr:hypothetical protein Tsubulata_039640 [Turnera subulata]